MKGLSSNSDELRNLLIALTDGDIDRRQFDRLQTVLSQDVVAQSYFRRYMRLCALIEFERAGTNYVPGIASTEDAPIPIVEQPSLPVLRPTAVRPARDFVEGPLFAYMTAMVVLCVMLFSAWIYKVDRDTAIAKSDSRPTRIVEQPAPTFVGRVTGAVDCRWAGSGVEPFVGAYVPLGQEFSLSSGLAEISYDAGAKVILEGPCTYTVDSRSGGHLAVGKLAARVEAGSGRIGESGSRGIGQPGRSPRRFHSLRPLIHHPHADGDCHRFGHRVWRRGGRTGLDDDAGVRRLGTIGERCGRRRSTGRAGSVGRTDRDDGGRRRVGRLRASQRFNHVHAIVFHRRAKRVGRRQTPMQNSSCRSARSRTIAWSGRIKKKTSLLSSIPLPAAVMES